MNYSDSFLSSSKKQNVKFILRLMTIRKLIFYSLYVLLPEFLFYSLLYLMFLTVERLDIYKFKVFLSIYEHTYDTVFVTKLTNLECQFKIIKIVHICQVNFVC